jgi:hypothetical protein
VRRGVLASDAVTRLGGGSSCIGDGPIPELLSECGLSAADFELARRSRGLRVEQISSAAGSSDIVTVLYALAELGVVLSIRGIGTNSDSQGSENDDAEEARVAALDLEAIRGRVRARVQLVDEADYFAFLDSACVSRATKNIRAVAASHSRGRRPHR